MKPLQPLPSNRHCIVARVTRLDPAAARRELLRGAPGRGDFRTIDTALPAAVKTVFGVYECGRRLMVAVCLRDIFPRRGGAKQPAADSVELLFNPWDDGIGYEQLVFSAGGLRGHHHFTPYEFARSSAFRHPAVLETRWQAPERPDEPAWLFAWFETADIFRAGDAVGFNVARAPANFYEPSSWNPCSGHGMQDATSFGRLHRGLPLDWTRDPRFEAAGGRLRLSGRADRGANLSFRLLGPLDEPVPFRAGRKGDRWEVRADLPRPEAGRCRLYATAPGRDPEPRYVAFDLDGKAKRPFTVAMTWDVPDDMLGATRPYTPEALAAEFDLVRAHGVSRIHWIDYPPETLYSRWRAVAPAVIARTRRNCGDLLPLAAALARERRLKFIGVFKPFDLAADHTNWRPAQDEPPVAGRSLRNLEGRSVWVPAEVARRQDCVQSLNPAWLPAGAGSLPATLRIVSVRPLPPAGKWGLKLWVSPDNRRYQPYRGPLTLGARRRRLPHRRWTAAGNAAGQGQGTFHVMEISGLKLDSPFMALEIRGELVLDGRAHAFAEAFDAAGRPVPVTLASAGGLEGGFSYWQEWVSWANTSPRLLEDVRWGRGAHGLVFEMRRCYPTLLEPCSAGTREIWLGRVRRIIESGADGLSIRTLCHHNNVMDYRQMAHAEPVRARFRAEHGREPRPDAADALLVRRLRGAAYTEFLRDAKALAAAAGKTLALHLEAGIEVPPEHGQRMEINLEWERWITEGIADELVLKWWFPQNPFIHERVLPLARRHRLPVFFVDRNSALVTSTRSVERATALLVEARRAGLAGVAWYEAADCKRRNAENVPEFRGHAGEAILRSARAAAGPG